MVWLVRKVLEEDYRNIYEINKKSLGYDYSPDKTLKRLKMIMKRDTEKIFVVYRKDTNEIGGYIHAADYECLYCGREKNILALAVDREYQNQGLGHLLIDAVEKWAIQDKCIAVRLVSGFERTNAHEFYKHCGYELRKTQKNFIKYISD